jgi:regulator of protease activity HflC (stomatin/prohibitin superfamily)
MLHTILSIISGLAIFWILYSTWFIVSPKKGRLIQRFGGAVVSEETSAGFYFKAPFPFNTVSSSFEMSQQICTEQIRIKSSDEVFLSLKITAFYQRSVSNLEASVFNLDDHESQMRQIIAESAKEVAPEMSVKDLYADKDKLQIAILKSTQDFFKAHGFNIKKIVVEDPVLDKKTEEASNRVYAATRDLEAAKIEKAATYQREVGSAEAAAQSLKLRTKAAGQARGEYAKEYAAAIQTFRTEAPGVPIEFLQQSLEGIDLRDAIISSADKKGNMTIVAMGSQQHAELTNLPLVTAIAKNAAEAAINSEEIPPEEGSSED